MDNTPQAEFVTIEAKALAAALVAANAVIERRIWSPILGCVRLSYSASGLTITATDLDRQITIAVDESDGAGTWAACIEAHSLARIAAVAGVSMLTMRPVRTEKSATDGKLHTEFTVDIAAGDASYTVPAMEAEDFPDLIGQRLQCIERFTNGQLPEMLKKLAYCISTEETRYYLNGVNWSAGPNGMRFAATDGHRLAMCRYAANENGTEFSHIIPRKTIYNLTKLFARQDVSIYAIGDGNVTNSNKLEFAVPGMVLRTKLIDGPYPEIDRVIPGGYTHSISIRRDDILQAIRQATAVSSDRFHAIRLHGVNGVLNVELKHPDTGIAKVATAAAWPEGVEDFGVNAHYMMDVLKKCEGEIRLGIGDAGHPLTLSDMDANMTRVVMPMRV